MSGLVRGDDTVMRRAARALAARREYPRFAKRTFRGHDVTFKPSCMPDASDRGLIDWVDGHPVSRRFGDVYFSRDSGVAETRHVFLDGNNLRERWARLAPLDQFCVGETGFGTGLN